MRTRTPIDFSKLTERELLMHTIPRIDAAEDAIDEQKEKQQRLETTQGELSRAMSNLEQNLVKTEERLAKRVDDRFDKVDTHLSKQDERLDRMVDSKRKWPDGAKITMTAVATLLVTVGCSVLLHLHF